MPKSAFKRSGATKVCTRCEKVKSSIWFWRDAKNEDGLKARCIPCCKAVRSGKKKSRRPRKRRVRKNIRVQNCRVCKKRLSITHFGKSTRHKTGYETACNFCRRLLVKHYRKPDLHSDPRISYETAASEYEGNVEPPEEKATRSEQAEAITKVQGKIEIPHRCESIESMMARAQSKCVCCANGHLEFLQELFERYTLVPKA